MLPDPLSLPVKMVLFAWAGFWSFFVVASEIGQPDDPLTKILICLGGLTFFLGTVLLALWQPKKGGVVLLSEGVALLVANLMVFHTSLETKCLLILTLALPPLLIGRYLITPTSQNGPRYC
ncbi:MAG: hypothetical protein SFU56_16085 [Capsulimonadales bacterium]|nr:hypothetical protein [Capsulimonadales bacterium]